ncbi:peptidase family M1-domain-containing protein [Dactylonectria macrodidyma]|uniref:Peptidase family M1-domain-containing protein n=1 Tax=Dactylonectria macrodidyma TaxID=307937 RepID=A0A9P9FMY8_9HYPO|nr:peptidase family M1-domain-containing protein [Dactylonectria macrodidyma]
MCRLSAFGDTSSCSNPEMVTTNHTEIDVTIDFERRVLCGTTVVTLEILRDDGINHVMLDTAYLGISSVSSAGKQLEWELKPWTEPSGCPLYIDFGQRVRKGDRIKLTIDFETETDSTGLQWFSPNQTDDKKYPFMFSQCEPIHARSIFPCQDTPSVKTTFDICVRSVLPVVASGIPLHDLLFPPVTEANEAKVYTFKQEIPISNYLFSVASGNLVSEQIGDRSYIYCSPGDLEACIAELKPDLEAIMTTVEKLIYEYPWPLYNLVILPKSFHLGGMENPIFNFYSATVISGDRENISVVAHEFAHSYSGNLVTNASWEHFWLNEGWTVYIERYVLRELRGQEDKTFHSIIGWQDLLYGIRSYGGNDSPFTKLVLEFEGKRPDDVMSKISYEKGYVFLCHLERTVGEDKWLRFVPHYFKTFFCKAVNSSQFRDCVFEFFASDSEATASLAAVDWEMWYHKPGAPPKPEFHSDLYENCVLLADQWKLLSIGGATDLHQPSKADVSGWTVGQFIAFLDRLIEFEVPVPSESVPCLGYQYGLKRSSNLEVLTRYLRVALRAGDRDALQQTRQVLGQTGRMKFVRPLFECLIEIDETIAVDTFQELAEFYHPTCVRLIKGILESKALL